MIKLEDLKQGEIYKIESDASYICYTTHKDGEHNSFAILITKGEGKGYIHEKSIDVYVNFGEKYSNFKTPVFLEANELEREWYNKCENDGQWYPLDTFESEIQTYEIY